PARGRARSIMLAMMAEVTVGQYLDIYAQAAPWSEDPGVDLDRARRVIRAKSASYSVQQPLRLGAAMAGAEQSGLAACAAFGLPIGEAFQLRDDVLGVFGGPALTGKPAGDDLREGKRTVLVTSAMTRADQEQRSVLRTALGNPDLQSQDVDRVREILTATGAVREVEDLIEERVAEALQVLDDSPVSPRAAAVLRSLVQAAVGRTCGARRLLAAVGVQNASACAARRTACERPSRSAASGVLSSSSLCRSSQATISSSSKPESAKSMIVPRSEPSTTACPGSS